jgi:hypothetical protein
MSVTILQHKNTLSLKGMQIVNISSGLNFYQPGFNITNIIRKSISKECEYILRTDQNKITCHTYVQDLKLSERRWEEFLNKEFL